MSEDWELGDLALCVALTLKLNGKLLQPSVILRVGAIYTVRSVRWSQKRQCTAIGLNEARSRGPNGDWPASIFRKIRPLTFQEQREALQDLPEQVPA